MTDGKTAPHRHLPTPPEALATVAQALPPVKTTEPVPLNQAAGRILAESAQADRDLPPADVSAMDGVAGAIESLMQGADGWQWPIDGEVLTGRDPGALTPGTVRRVFTGGAIPAGADVVIPREWFVDHGDAITLRAEHQAQVIAGRHIRMRGENIRAGAIFAQPGQRVTPAMAAALASFGVTRVKVYRRLRVMLLTTGNEVVPADTPPGPFEIRNSNAFAVQTMLATLPVVDQVLHEHIPDEPDRLIERLRSSLVECDAVLLTGGVSVGHHDHVPASLEAVGARTWVHRIAMRPGKPNLGATGPNGQLIWGLPGNPVSVLVGLRRFVMPLLEHRAGLPDAEPAPATVRLDKPATGPEHLWLYPPVRLGADGTASIVAHRGSGDPVGLAASDGFVEVPAVTDGLPERVGPFPFYPWMP